MWRTVQDEVERRLVAAGLDDVVRAFVLLSAAAGRVARDKGVAGCGDALKLSLATVTVLGERYLRCDRKGRMIVSTGEMLESGLGLDQGRRTGSLAAVGCAARAAIYVYLRSARPSPTAGR